jgi:hypothetical protein
VLQVLKEEFASQRHEHERLLPAIEALRVHSAGFFEEGGSLRGAEREESDSRENFPQQPTTSYVA